MKRFLFTHRIEIIVFSAILVVLTIVIAPRFHNAQVKTKVTQAQLGIVALSDYLAEIQSERAHPYDKTIKPHLVTVRINSNPYKIYGSIRYPQDVSGQRLGGSFTEDVINSIHPDFVFMPIKTNVPDLDYCFYKASLGKTSHESVRLAKSAGITLTPRTISAHVIGPYAERYLFGLTEHANMPPYAYPVYDSSNGLLSHGYLFHTQTLPNEPNP